MKLIILLFTILKSSAFSLGANNLPINELKQLKKVVAVKDYKKAAKIFEKIEGNLKSKTDKAYRRFYILARKEFYKLPENAEKIIPEASSLEGSSGVEAREHNYRARFLRGEYSKALDMIDLERAISDQNFSMIVEHDFLNILIKKSYKNLRCEKNHNENKMLMLVNYDHSICSMIIDWKNKKKIVKSKMEHLESLVTKDFPEKKYLVKALRSLK